MCCLIGEEQLPSPCMCHYRAQTHQHNRRPPAVLYNSAGDGVGVPAQNMHSVLGASYAGAISVTRSNLTITGDCHVAHNVLPLNGGSGGGIAINVISQLIAGPGLRLYNNSAAGLGGGILLREDSVLRLEGARIEGNRALTGGGIYVQDTSRATLLNCLIADNAVTSAGGGINTPRAGVLNMTNVTISNNSVGTLPRCCGLQLCSQACFPSAACAAPLAHAPAALQQVGALVCCTPRHSWLCSYASRRRSFSVRAAALLPTTVQPCVWTASPSNPTRPPRVPTWRWARVCSWTSCPAPTSALATTHWHGRAPGELTRIPVLCWGLCHGDQQRHGFMGMHQVRKAGAGLQCAQEVACC